MAALNIEDRKNLRLISHSEVSTYHQCQRRHDLAYAGQLLGGETLRAKVAAPILRDGRAWGAMVAEWHLTGDTSHAIDAMMRSLDEDAAAMHEAGVPQGTVDEQFTESRDTLSACFDHYVLQHDVESLDVTKLGRIPGHSPEDKILVAIPSRSGKRDSNRYGLDARLDLVYTDERGLDWIVEFKLRKSLTSFDQLTRMQQLKWYAWAWHKRSGRQIAGVIIDERLKAAPKPPKILKNGSVSSDKRQLCTAAEYEGACRERGQEPDAETLVALGGRQWGQRYPLFFTSKTLDEVGQQLVSAAQQIYAADTGQTYPLTNATQMNCNGCPFREICADIHNRDFVDHYFDRRAPKASLVKAEKAAA